MLLIRYGNHQNRTINLIQRSLCLHYFGRLPINPILFKMIDSPLIKPRPENQCCLSVSPVRTQLSRSASAKFRNLAITLQRS